MDSHAPVCACAGATLLAAEEALPGRLAFLLWAQLEAEAADDALLAQATKNLVHLAPILYDADSAAGRVPEQAPAPAANGSNSAAQHANGSVSTAAGPEGGSAQHAEEGNEEEEGEEGTPVQGAALTLHGLVRRMARLGGDARWGRERARCAALRFAAALASRLGAEKVAPYLPALLRPLLRLTEAGAPAPDEVRLSLPSCETLDAQVLDQDVPDRCICVGHSILQRRHISLVMGGGSARRVCSLTLKWGAMPVIRKGTKHVHAQVRQLAEEVLAHVRSVAGSDSMLAAYNAARATVAAQRQERRRQKAVQARIFFGIIVVSNYGFGLLGCPAGQRPGQ